MNFEIKPFELNEEQKFIHQCLTDMVTLCEQRKIPLQFLQQGFLCKYYELVEQNKQLTPYAQLMNLTLDFMASQIRDPQQYLQNALSVDTLQ